VLETCISDDQAKKCLEALKINSLISDKLQFEEQNTDSLQTELTAIKQQLSTDVAELQMWQARAKASEKQAAEMAMSLDQWYHNPFMMGLVGFAGGVIVTSAIVIAVQR
jgi:hypothetical protein